MADQRRWLPRRRDSGARWRAADRPPGQRAHDASEIERVRVLRYGQRREDVLSVVLTPLCFFLPCVRLAKRAPKLFDHPPLPTHHPRYRAPPPTLPPVPP